MQHQVLHSIGRFFAGTGRVLSTPSGDARGHMNVRLSSLYDFSDIDRHREL